MKMFEKKIMLEKAIQMLDKAIKTLGIAIKMLEKNNKNLWVKQ